MARHTRTKPSNDDWKSDQWPYTMPTPEAHEGGHSVWEQWEAESRRLDLAFAPTQPSGLAPLAPESSTGGVPLGSLHRLSAEALMVEARRNNRVCPRQGPWTLLYRLLEGDRFADLQPPPVQPWMWSKLSSLQKRLRFREHVEWAERHGCLSQIALFMDGLTEADWLHMGEG